MPIALQGSGERQQRLAGAGLAGNRHQLHLRVQQGVDGKGLFDIARVMP